MKGNNGLKWIKRIIIVILWVLVINSVIYGLNVKEYFDNHPQLEYESSIYGGLPEEAEIKIEMYNNLQTRIHIGLLLVFIFLIVDYFYDPEHHFVTPIMKQIDKYFENKNIEEDLDEEKD
jgi:hypothetical protein